MRISLLIIFEFAMLFPSISQSPEGKGEKVKYTHEFMFKEGIYLNFDQVKNNDPLRKYKILTNANYHDNDFFDKVLENDIIFYFDDKSARQEVSNEKIWGYSRAGVLYIAMNDDFMRIAIMGGICHFVGAVTTTDTRYIDPYNPY